MLAELGVSQGELVRRTGLSRMAVFDAYHGRSKTTVDTWARIARALGVPLARLDPEAAQAIHGVASY